MSTRIQSLLLEELKKAREREVFRVIMDAGRLCGASLTWPEYLKVYGPHEGIMRMDMVIAEAEKASNREPRIYDDDSPGEQE